MTAGPDIDGRLWQGDRDQSSRSLWLRWAVDSRRRRDLIMRFSWG